MWSSRFFFLYVELTGTALLYIQATPFKHEKADRFSFGAKVVVFLVTGAAIPVVASAYQLYVMAFFHSAPIAHKFPSQQQEAGRLKPDRSGFFLTRCYARQSLDASTLR